MNKKVGKIVEDAKGTYADATDVEEYGFWGLAGRHCGFWTSLCLGCCYEGIIVEGGEAERAHTYARVASW